jgi:hypothetical protein
MDLDIDPVESANSANEGAETHESGLSLGALVAITVALLATFLGVCKIKDDNIGQAMERVENERLDHWNFYQARNIRQEIADSTLETLELAAESAPASEQGDYRAAIQKYQALSKDQSQKKEELRVQAEDDLKTYDALNYRDDQFDLSDALLALAISLLAVTALTRKRWLYWLALIPTAAGVLMGLAGLFGWRVHPDMITKWLGG